MDHDFLKKNVASNPYYSNYIANKAITFFSNRLNGLKLSDIQTCYIAFRGDLIRNMIITSSTFGFEVEATAKIAKLKVPVVEVPITYHARTYKDGKKLAWTDGFAAVWNIFKYNVLTDLKGSFNLTPDKSAEELNAQ